MLLHKINVSWYKISIPVHKINISVHKTNISWYKTNIPWPKSVYTMALIAPLCIPPIFGNESNLCLVTKTKIGLLCQVL